MASNNRITVDAGGTLFKTTVDRSTLLMSGAGYFEALFGPTGSALGVAPLHENFDDNGAGNDSGNNGAGNDSGNNNGGERSSKRARTTEATAASTSKSTREVPAEIFVDRNPNLFSDVLDFMRCGKLSAKVRQDFNQLDDLKTEAEFFIYDALKDACIEAQKELEEAVAKIVGPEPTAEFRTIVLRANDFAEERRIAVPKGKVAYLVSATLAGRLQVARYRKSRKEKKESSDIAGCYIDCEEEDSGDFQLTAYLDGKHVCLAHVGLNHIHLEPNQGLDVDFRHPLGICLTGNSNGHMTFAVSGHADWHILYWIGDAEAIPGLKSPEYGAKRKRVVSQAAGENGGLDEFNTLLAMNLLM